MKILIIAAHPDDELMGVGGTILKHVKKRDKVYILMLTKSENEEEALNKKEKMRKIHKSLGIEKTYFLDLPTTKLDTFPQKDINDKISEKIKLIEPEIVYTHHRRDLNSDHRIAFNATLVATRPANCNVKKLLSYEVPSSTEWSFSKSFNPNSFVEISDFLSEKIELMKIYDDELKDYPHPRSLKALEIFARARGTIVGVDAAETFMIIFEKM